MAQHGWPKIGCLNGHANRGASVGENHARNSMMTSVLRDSLGRGPKCIQMLLHLPSKHIQAVRSKNDSSRPWHEQSWILVFAGLFNSFWLASTASKGNWRELQHVLHQICRVGSCYIPYVSYPDREGGNCKTVMVGTAAIEDRHLEEFWAQHGSTFRIPIWLPLAHWHPCSGLLQIIPSGYD